MGKKLYLTTAIDYVNSKPHLGTAYEKIAADCLARAHRLLGYDVYFVMGNDEHSVNVEKSAKAAGLEPQAYTDRMEGEFREAWKRLDISFDDFIRTSEKRHHTAVKELLRRVQAAGHIYRSKYSGWYCEGCEAFYTEKDLVEGNCPNHATKPRWVEEENWFFRLSQFGAPLLEHIRQNPDFIRPATRRNEIVAFLEGGLEDLSISRAGVTWGIPFPDDPSHVVYVWFDALANYISAAGFATDDAKFAKWWPADCHIVGKDITRFHCVIWPAMLMAAGLPLPVSVFGHGFIYHSGVKMSKSLGNIVNPLDVVGVTGADPLRYFLLREIVFGKDGDFTWDAFLGRYHADLANDLGNLVKRTCDMTVKFLAGKIEARERGAANPGLATFVNEKAQAATAAYQSYHLSEALGLIWEIVRRANGEIERAKPWELAKDPAKRGDLARCLGDLLEAIRIVAHLVEPAMPSSGRAIRERLGLDPSKADWASSLEFRASATWQVASAPPLFPRVEAPPAAPAAPAGLASSSAASSVANAPDAVPPSKASAPATLARGAKAEAPAAPPSAIDLDQFRDVELVIATVLSAERVAGADRLLKLQLDLGSEQRQVVSGIAEHFRPEDLPGRQVVLVANLKPTKIRGIESQGMILAAKADGKLTLIAPGSEISPGAKVS